jgi:hypothetical protein
MIVALGLHPDIASADTGRQTNAIAPQPLFFEKGFKNPIC